jgi:hypothetical protein
MSSLVRVSPKAGIRDWGKSDPFSDDLDQNSVGMVPGLS